MPDDAHHEFCHSVDLLAADVVAADILIEQLLHERRILREMLSECLTLSHELLRLLAMQRGRP